MKLFRSLNEYPEFKDLLNNIHIIKEEYLNFLNNNLYISRNLQFKKAHLKTIEWIKQQKNDETYYQEGKNANNWIVIPLFKRKFCFLKEFQETNKLLKKIKSLNFAGCFCLKSNQSIPYHKHDTKTVIIHINLFPLKKGRTFTYLDESLNGDPNTVEEYSSYFEKKYMEKEGDYVIFNPFLYHCAKNKSLTDRITFGVEIKI